MSAHDRNPLFQLGDKVSFVSQGGDRLKGYVDGRPMYDFDGEPHYWIKPFMSPVAEKHLKLEDPLLALARFGQ
jgi:hypothetical protein